MFGDNYEKSKDRESRKKIGAFYTPESLVNSVLQKTLAGIDILENPFLKLLDPSCGCGYFLLSAYKFLFVLFEQNLKMLQNKFKHEWYFIESSKENKKINGFEYWRIENLSYHILKNCIYGSDIDERAVEITKENLNRVSKSNVNLDSNIICCNSLIRWDKDYTVVGKTKEIKNKILFWSRKYDYIVGNPPWVSLSRKFKNNIDETLANYYMKNYNGNKYLPNLYEYFIKRSLEVLNKNGKLGFVIPDRFAKNIQYKDFRKYIVEKYNIVNLVFDVEFPGINTDTMIFVLQNKFDKHNKVIVEDKNTVKYITEQSNYIKNFNTQFYSCQDIKYNSIKDIIESNSYKLGDISTTFTGFIGKSSIITKNRKTNSQIKIIKGENIDKYKVLGNFYYEFIDENIKGGTKNLDKLRYKGKIVIRKTGREIVSAIDYDGNVIEQSLYGIIVNSEAIYPEYILGILNSKLMKWYYRNFMVTNYRSMPQIKKYSLDRIPIRICDTHKEEYIRNIVLNIINCTDENEIKILQGKLDNIIFSIYGIHEDSRKSILQLLEVY
jgi:adenine-specific DNA-methyltransferase